MSEPPNKVALQNIRAIKRNASRWADEAFSRGDQPVQEAFTMIEGWASAAERLLDPSGAATRKEQGEPMVPSRLNGTRTADRFPNGHEEETSMEPTQHPDSNTSTYYFEVGDCRDEAEARERVGAEGVVLPLDDGQPVEFYVYDPDAEDGEPVEGPFATYAGAFQHANVEHPEDGIGNCLILRKVPAE